MPNCFLYCWAMLSRVSVKGDVVVGVLAVFVVGKNRICLAACSAAMTYKVELRGCNRITCWYRLADL